MAKIPRPKKRTLPFHPADSQGLAASMGLSGTIEERNLYCRMVSDVAELYDEHEHRMDRVRVGSRSGPWPEFLEEIQKVHPTLIESYKAAWPVGFIVRGHRARKRDQRSGRKSKGLASWTEYMVNNSTSERREERIAALSSARPQTMAGRSKPSPSHAPSAFQVDSAQTESRIARCRDGAAPSSRNTQATGTSTAGGKCTIEKPEPMAKSKPGSILAFLNSLSPPQPALLPVFMAMGVTDTDALRQLARMASWLHGWVTEEKMTEFQFAVIRAGLQKLPEE